METQDQILFLYCLLARSLSGRKVLRGMFWNFLLDFWVKSLNYLDYDKAILGLSLVSCMYHSGPLQNLWIGHCVPHLQARWQEAVQFVQCLVDEEFWSQDSNPPLPESQPLSNSAICCDGNVTIQSLCPPPMSHRSSRMERLCLGQVPHPHEEVHNFM